MLDDRDMSGWRCVFYWVGLHAATAILKLFSNTSSLVLLIMSFRWDWARSQSSTSLDRCGWKLQLDWCGGVKPWGSCSDVLKRCDTLQSAGRLGVFSERFPFYHVVQRTSSAQGVFANLPGDADVRGPVNISNFWTTGPGQKHIIVLFWLLFHLGFTAWRFTEMFPDIICRSLFYPILERALNKTLPG